MTEKPSRYAVAAASQLFGAVCFFSLNLRLLPPDLHLLCVGDGRGCQCSVVWPDDVRNHGRHASGGAGVRTRSGHRTVV